MITLNNLFKLKDHKTVEPSVLNELFRMERSTLITLMLLETILLYILTPLLGNAIIAWYGITMSLSLWRLYNAYDYKNHPERNTMTVWHEKFVVQVWLTALLFSILAILSMPNLDSYYQLFVFIVLVGISSGAVKALSVDHRTAIGYLIIMLFPLMVEMLLLMRKDTYILAFLLVIYFFTQMSIILNSYERTVQLKEKEREVAIAKAKLHEKQEIVQRFFEQASEALFSYDKDLNILDCNDSFLEFIDMEKEEITGKSLDSLPLGKIAEIAKSSLRRSRKIYRGNFKTYRGAELWIEAKFSTILDKNGEVSGGIALIEDKTREHQTREELEYLVSHDPLTSVSNRRGFHQYMGELVKKERHKNHYSLLFYFDLNKFKQINDMYGHETGDWVLIETTMRLKKIIDKDCNLTRLGGDEFCVVIPFVSTSREGAHEKMNEWVNLAAKEFEEPFEIEDRTFDVGYSIGVVFVEPDMENVDEIVRYADISMFDAKKGGDGNVSIYCEEMGERYKRLYTLQQDLKRALREDEFELFFQPIYTAVDDRLHSAEVLIRWRHPQKGLLEPGEFLDIASKSGKITDIDEWVFENTCKTIARWKREGIFKLSNLSVNIDAKLLFKKDIVPTLMGKLDEYGIKNGEIKLEITEASLVDNFQEAQKVLEELCCKGVQCAIDDFGTGYSSLSYLKKLSFGILKIDREFIMDLTERIENIFLVKTIIDMGKRLNYDIVVEGVENEKQKAVLSSIEPDIMYQGYLISRPIPENEFIEKFLGAEDMKRRS